MATQAVTPKDPAASRWAAAYAGGASTAAIAADAGVHPTTVGKAIRDLGVQMRTRGARPAVCDQDVIREIGDDPPNANAVARRLGVSRHAVRSALRRIGLPPATGVPMTAAQTRRLAGLMRRCPRGRGAHYDLRSTAGQRLLVQIGRLIDAGVHTEEIGMVAGVTGATVRRWIS